MEKTCNGHVEKIDMEEWRDIHGYEGLYQVSDQGRVRSLERTIVTTDGEKRFYKRKIIKQVFNSSGYLFVGLYKYGKKHCLTVHRIVAFAFPEICGEFFPGAVVDHISTVKTDNTPYNLRWVTPKENMMNPITYKRIRDSRKKVGDTMIERFKNSGRFREVEMLSLSGEVLGVFFSQKEACRKTGINNRCIGNCCRGEQETAGGFVWKYAE